MRKKKGIIYTIFYFGTKVLLYSGLYLWGYVNGSKQKKPEQLPKKDPSRYRNDNI